MREVFCGFHVYSGVLQPTLLCIIHGLIAKSLAGKANDGIQLSLSVQLLLPSASLFFENH